MEIGLDNAANWRKIGELIGHVTYNLRILQPKKYSSTVGKNKM